MPMDLKKNNPKWHCLDYGGKTFVLNNVMLIPKDGSKPIVLRIAKFGDSPKNMIQINLSFIGVANAWYYVPAKPHETIQHPNLYWLFNGIHPPIKVYSPE
jgi:hypothetical protein